MASYYYGVQTALAYIFNHFFYNAVHYSYVSGEYYPYKGKNPRSSSPHRIYEDLYEPWRENDEFSKVVNQVRLNIKGGILAKENQSVIDSSTSARLNRICDQIDHRIFYPFVYRVDTKIIPPNRLLKAGSGRLGSNEYLIADLKESEIDEILFLDYQRDATINNLVRKEYFHFRKSGACRVSQIEVLLLLEERVRKNASSKIVSAVGAKLGSKTP